MYLLDLIGEKKMLQKHGTLGYAVLSKYQDSVRKNVNLTTSGKAGNIIKHLVRKATGKIND